MTRDVDDETNATQGSGLWHNARVLTMATPDAAPIDGGAVAVRHGRLAWVGPEDAVPSEYGDLPRRDCEGRWILPAFIDAHTHLVHAGHRADEFEQRLEGASYESISRAGGGIASTVRAVNAADEHALLAASLPRLDALMAEGVGTVEIKSGYGLNVGAELRMLRAARRLGTLCPVRITTTYLAAHAVPPDYRGRPDDYIREVAIPGLEQGHAEGLIDAVDGFCEDIAFSTAQLEPLFDRAKALGLPLKLHTEQLTASGGAAFAAGYGALSCDHLEHLDQAGVQAMARAGTVAMLLPGAAYALRETVYPPVSALRAAGVPMALATDCNPGTSPLTSLLLAMNMGATLFGLTVREALAGTTREAARALGLLHETGTLEAGKSADFCVWDVDTPAELVYYMGFRPVHLRVFRGEFVSP